MSTITTTAPSTPDVFAGIENFFTGLGNDVSHIATNLGNDITWLESEVAGAYKWVNAQLPVAYATVQNILQSLATATEAIVPNLTGLISIGQALLTAIEGIFETTGVVAPGGSAA